MLSLDVLLRKFFSQNLALKLLSGKTLVEDKKIFTENPFASLNVAQFLNSELE